MSSQKSLFPSLTRGVATAAATPSPPANPLKRLSETNVAEGNILEYPLFKLSNKAAKPKRKNGLLAKEDYTSEHILAPGVRIVIEADMHHGYPTIFGMRVLLAVIEKSRALGFPSRRLPIKRSEIARSIGYTTYGGDQYLDIKNALLALYKLTIIFENTWYDPTTKTTVPSTKPERLITDFYIGATRANDDELSLNYNEEFIELGERLFRSLQGGYRIGVDLDYLNNLSTPTSQRLYSYLTKKDGGGRSSYSENILALAKKLPIATQKPAGVLRILEPALRELQAEQSPTCKQFIQSFAFEGKGRNTQLHVIFATSSLRDAVRQRSGQS